MTMTRACGEKLIDSVDGGLGLKLIVIGIGDTKWPKMMVQAYR